MEPLILTDANFKSEVLDSQIPVLVDFWATWCGPCKVIAPIIHELAEEYNGKIKVGKLDVDDSPQTASSYGIRGIPTILIFNNRTVIDQAVGLVKKNVLTEKLNNLLK
jgi:thioredoxin 1